MTIENQTEYDLLRPASRWYGDIRMRLGEDARKCVVFFGLRHGDAIRYGGTGFLIRYYYEGGARAFYLVTARHIAEVVGNTGFVMRVNTTEGNSRELEPDWVDWTFHPDKTVDLAIAEWFPPKWSDLIGFSAARFVSEERQETKNIGPGGLVYIVGLFRLLSGSKRNLAVVHTGHIALNPEDEKIPFKDHNSGEIIETEGYLVEAQTLTGLSGSPVFVRRSVEWRPNKNSKTWTYGRVYLLGVWQGSWDAPPGEVLEEDRSLGQNIRVPVGMGIVAPAYKITEILKMPEIQNRRQRTQEKEKASRAAVTDTALPTTDENPQHREDFNRLLDAAVPGNKSDR